MNEEVRMGICEDQIICIFYCPIKWVRKKQSYKRKRFYRNGFVKNIAIT